MNKNFTNLLQNPPLKFGKLTVVEYNGSVKKGRSTNHFWKCLCDCGNIKIINTSNLIRATFPSCGCYSKELMGKTNCTHGETLTSEYTSWKQMKSRCYNINNDNYHHYGGRGISVCERWFNSYENFKLDMGPKPTSKNTRYSLERKDVNGNYEPDNCIWATDKEQANNTRTSKFYEFNGEKHTCSEWADIMNLNKNTLYSRLYSGWSIEDALTLPPKANKSKDNT